MKIILERQQSRFGMVRINQVAADQRCRVAFF